MNDFTDRSYNVAVQTDILPDRGFTGHEYLPWFKLYNMNGRLYDPVVGRFLEPDPVIQNATSTQNLNRYSYALNNPLRYVDPSGNSFKQSMDDWYGEGNYWYRGDAPGTWGGDRGFSSSVGGGSSMPGSYNYDWTTGNYYNSWGKRVSFNEVYNYYIFPNSSSDRLFGHISSTRGYSSGAMIDGFKLNGVLYEFDGPVPYNKSFFLRESGSWTSNVDWAGVTNSSLNVLGGVGELMLGGAGEYLSVGLATPVCIPLIADGGFRTATNFTRLVGYLTLNDRFANAMPGNIGATIGKGIDMASGKSFYDYGFGQGFGGVTNDFVSFIVTGGTAGSINNMVGNPSLMNGMWYMSTYGGYTNSLFYDLYPLKK